MKHNARPVGWFLALFLTGTHVLVVDGQTKPTVVEHFHVEERGGLPSIKAMWDASNIVVEGIIGDDHPTDYNAPALQITTTYDVNIVEVFKGSADVTAATTTIRVRRTGGTRDRGDRFVRREPDNYPLFQRGERYVLFLMKHEWALPAPYTGVFYTDATRTPDSAVAINGMAIRPLGRSTAVRSLASTSPAELRALLRRGGVQ